MKLEEYVHIPHEACDSEARMIEAFPSGFAGGAEAQAYAKHHYGWAATPQVPGRSCHLHQPHAAGIDLNINDETEIKPFIDRKLVGNDAAICYIGMWIYELCSEPWRICMEHSV